MAKKKISSTNRDDIKREMKKAEAQKQDEKNSISTLESEIEALENLKARLIAEKDSIGYQKDSLDSWYTSTSDWRGDCYNRYLGHITELKTKYSYAYERADGRLDDICDEIARRKNQIEEHNGVLGWLSSRINDLKNEWEKCNN